MPDRILITGSDGFIGSHLVERLVRDGRSVRAFTCYNSFGSWGWLDTLPAEVLKSIEVVMGDVRDSLSVDDAVKGCSGILHLAALIAIPFSYRAPESYVDVNVRGTLNIVSAARRHQVTKVVVTSTSEVYGTAQFVPITEEHPVVGQSPYSASKIGADQIALSFYRSFGTPVAVARPFNTYGPRQSTRAVIPTIITQIAAGQRVIRLGAVTPTRDFNFVTDTAAGLIAVFDSPNSVGEVINLGSGYEISVGDTAKLIAEVMGVNLEIQTDQDRLRPQNSEVERLLADASKAKKLLGWGPRFGGREGLKQGLHLTAAWFNDPANLARYRIGGYQT